MELDKHTVGWFIAAVIIYFLSGGVLVAGACYFLVNSDPIVQLIVTKDISIALLFIGIFIIISSIFGGIGAWQPFAYKRFIVIMGFCIIFVTLCQMLLGLLIWFYTLTPKALFYSHWIQWPIESKAIIQYKGQCCGYNNSTDYIVPMKMCHTNNGSTGCYKFLAKVSSSLYVDIYTTLFVFILINFFVLLSLTVLIQVRNEIERYEKGGQKAGTK